MGDGFDRSVDGLVGRRDDVEERASGFGQLHPGPRPVEQPDLELLFRSFHRLADRGLGHVEVGGSPTQAAGACRRHDDSERAIEEP